MSKIIDQELQGTPAGAAGWHRKLKNVSILGLVTAVFVFAVGTALISPALRADHDHVFTVDVATDPANYKQINVDNKPGSTDVFSRGDSFLMNGTVYPGGSIVAGQAKNLPTDPGSIGKYLLRGTYTQNVDQFEKAVAERFLTPRTAAPELLAGTELFTFADGATILTDGLWPNAYRRTTRVVLGGTGRFQNAAGTVTEENIGENGALGFCNLRLTFHLRD